MLDFRPPRDNEFIIGLARIFRPLILGLKMEDAEVRVLGDGIKRLEELKGKHVMITPNHSHRHDPEVMFELSCQAGEEFNFIAAREVFDWNNGLNGWFLQRMGCYSVVRGAVDRESFKTTKRLLVEGKKKLVLFPEGEISRQNDVLLPLESGAAQLSFMALDELQKSKSNEAIYIVPVALKYTYKNDLTSQLNGLISEIEDKLGTNNRQESSLYKRVRLASELVLKTLEAEYDLKAAPDADLNQRIKALKSHILKTMADVLHVSLPETGSNLDWVRILRNTLDDHIYTDEDELPPYQRKIHEEKSEKIKAFYADLDRVVRFIAIYDGYLSPPITQERLVNVIELLEAEVFGQAKIKGPRLVLISVGEAINLLDYYDEYKKNKKPVIEKLRSRLSEQLFKMLCEADKQRQSVFVN
ncbi:MAG: 1-acyl-sn-glycerol-3-phosphate acyltransferase [Candidatus Obscuribacterales bacterium]|nr:1-acyl-sn-glycerol-3-phosphate acyltransferase [Candidatus Obscuribacterales bacterium]